MIRYFIKRILMLIPVIMAVSLIVFTLMNIIPGDPLSRYNLDSYTEEEIAELRKELGLDDPILLKYGRYMLRLIQGDLGISDLSKISVWEAFISRLPNTLFLAGSAFIIGVSIAIPMGVTAARHSGKVTDNITTAITMVGMSMPGFWLGILLILLFSYKLKWFPTGGLRDGVSSVVLPAIAASAGLIATATRQTRSSMLEVLRADYLRTARAKGMPERIVIRKHALGNALIPIVTSVGLALGAALAGSAVVETVFAWPGIGRYVVESVNSRDITATTGAIVLTTILYCLVQLGVDLVYAFIDPRIKAQYVSKAKAKRRTAKPVSANSAVTIPVPGIQTTTTLLKTEESGGARDIAAIQIDDDSSRPEEMAFAQADSITLARPPSQAENMQIDIIHTETNVDDAGAATETAVAQGELVTQKYRKRSQIAEVFHHLRQNPGAVTGMVIISLMLVLFVASFFIPFSAVTEGSVLDRFTPPNATFPFGTDEMGRNLLSRVVYAARFSLPIGVGATLFAALFGVLLGSHASYYGGLADDIIMRFSDTLASIPGLLKGMVIVSALGRSLPNLIIAIGISTIPTFIRTSRASVFQVKGNEYVEAARAIGLSNFRIIFTEVLPNAFAPIMISFSIALGGAILVSASLSFLGFGIPVPNPEWGSLVSAGRDTIRTAPWLTTFPGMFIMLTVMGFNMLGDGLRDAFDPKLKK